MNSIHSVGIWVLMLQVVSLYRQIKELLVDCEYHVMVWYVKDAEEYQTCTQNLRVATQTNNYRGLVQKFHRGIGIDNVHIIVHII